MAKKVVATDIFNLVNHWSGDDQSPSDTEKNERDIYQLPIKNLVPYEGQPFKPYTQEKLISLAEDIRDNGLINPIIVRPIGKEQYQILAGHNRVNACRMLGMDEVSSIIKDVDNNQAALIMLNSNLNQRDELRPSEKAFAYRMQMDTLSRQGKRIDLCTNCAQDEDNNLCSIGAQVKSRDIIANQNNTSREQIRRYIRLTYLIQPFLDRVDNGDLPFRAGVNLSYLTECQQDGLLNYVDTYNIKISLEQSEKLKDTAKVSEEQGILLATLDEVFGRTPKDKKTSSPIGKAFKAAAGRKEVAEYFAGKNKKEVEEIIVEALMLFHAAKKTKDGES